MHTTELILRSSLKKVIPISLRENEKKNQVSLFNLAINGVGFSTNPMEDNFISFNANDRSCADIFFHFFSHLSFLDICEIQNKLAEDSIPIFSFEELFKVFQLPFNQRFIDLGSEIINYQNNNVKLWFFEKKIKPQELLFLFNLNFQDRKNVLEKISVSRISKMQALQYLEWLSDLILLKQAPPEIFFDSINEENFEKLKALRFPNSFMKHPLVQKNISWGSQIQAHFVRKNDRAGFQIQTFVSSPEELDRTIDQLKKTLESWKQPSLNHQQF